MMLKKMLHPFAYTCGHTHKLLFDFAEGTLEPTIARKLEAHLQDCPECLEFVRTYREAKRLSHELGRLEREIPPELERKLVEFIRTNLPQK
jgi:anti-sigma factor RsiW